MCARWAISPGLAAFQRGVLRREASTFCVFACPGLPKHTHGCDHAAARTGGTRDWGRRRFRLTERLGTNVLPWARRLYGGLPTVAGCKGSISFANRTRHSASGRPTPKPRILWGAGRRCRWPSRRHGLRYRWTELHWPRPTCCGATHCTDSQLRRRRGLVLRNCSICAKHPASAVGVQALQHVQARRNRAGCILLVPEGVAGATKGTHDLFFQLRRC